MGRFTRQEQFFHATPECVVEPLQGILPNHPSRRVDCTGYRHGPASCFSCFGFRCNNSTEKCSVCPDRKSTRLNSSHLGISYAVFCLKKKKKPATQSEDRTVCSVQHWRPIDARDT